MSERSLHCLTVIAVMEDLGDTEMVWVRDGDSLVWGDMGDNWKNQQDLSMA